jgi:tetrapyrrole methylase family protein/MazG family protein
MENLREELGDVLLQVALHSVIAEEQQEFTIDEVVHEVSQKMIRRHPHVFGLSEENSRDGVAAKWEEIKQMEHKEKTIGESIEAVPKAMPASMRATKIQKKLLKAGLNLDTKEKCFEWINNSLNKLRKSCENSEKTGIEEAYGEFLFTVLNLSVILGVNEENSLTNQVDKFINSLVGIERIASREGKRLSELSINYVNELWKLK